MTGLLSPIGSGFIPSVWCPDCNGVCHTGASCPCQATDASSIPYRVVRLLRERYPRPTPSWLQVERWRL